MAITASIGIGLASTGYNLYEQSQQRKTANKLANSVAPLPPPPPTILPAPKRVNQGQGRASTILTGPSGATQAAPTEVKTLLGA